MTPEIADSIGEGTRSGLERVWFVGTASVLVTPAWNCQMPFKFSQFVLTICGRGYSGSGAFVSIRLSQRVISGPRFICQAPASVESSRLANRGKTRFI